MTLRYELCNDYALLACMLSASQNYVVNRDVVVDYPMNGATSVTRALETYIEGELIRMRQYKKHPIFSALDLIGMCYSYLRQNVRMQKGS